MSFATIDDLRASLGGKSSYTSSAEYKAKMMHPIPSGVTEVDRMKFILEHCTGKRVLEFGASGPLHTAIVNAASACLGVDREAAKDVVAFDLDDVSKQTLPEFANAEIIICGEILEHLSNPGWFLTRLKKQYPGVPLIISVPNAYGGAAKAWALKGFENVNGDHVAWYSPKVLAVLLTRSGYAAGGLFWYGGKDASAEGLVVVTE